MKPELLAALRLPFREQETFFREKLNIPTHRWDDLWKDQHAKGFMVAGAYRDDLLADFRAAVDRAITQGATLEDFRKDFDGLVQQHGWSYKGSRNWRSELIYSTNIRTSYAAGRWAQLTDPEQLKVMPYLTYRHGGSRDPRPEHLAWDGLTLPADDPFWDDHYPPNGFGCTCRVHGATQSEYERARAAGKAQRPPSPVDPTTGEAVGIDRGWGHNVGKAAFGASWAPDSGDFEELGAWRRDRYPDLPKRLQGGPLPVALGAAARGEREIRAAVPEGRYRDAQGETVNVTQALADHLLEDPKRLDGRERYFPLIPDVVQNPAEVWVGFMRDKGSGRVYLRRRYVSAYEVGGGRAVGVLADTVKGQVTTFGAFHSDNMTGGRLRSGRLIYQAGQ